MGLKERSRGEGLGDRERIVREIGREHGGRERRAREERRYLSRDKEKKLR